MYVGGEKNENYIFIPNKDITLLFQIGRKKKNSRKKKNKKKETRGGEVVDFNRRDERMK